MQNMPVMRRVLEGVAVKLLYSIIMCIIMPQPKDVLASARVSLSL